MRTLIADDDSNVRGLVRRVLTRQFGSLDVVECDTGLAAMELLTDGEFDLVLLDVSMPLMDGIDVLQSIRRAPAISGLPVIMMTGSHDEGTIRQTLELGISDYIVKPIHPAQLCERVLKFLTRAPGADQRKGLARPAFRPLVLTPTTSVLLADGSAEFRQFFHQVVSPHCAVETVSSGLAAFQRCLDQPPYALFVGSDLGIVPGETLTRKLRALPKLCGVRLIGIESGRGLVLVRKRGIYEAAIMRSFVREVFAESIESLLRSPAPGDGLRDVPDLKLLAIGAAEESLSDALGEHVLLRPTTSTTQAAGAAVTLRIGADRTPLLLRLSTPGTAAERLLRHARQQNPGATTYDEMLLALAERLAASLAQEIRGRSLMASHESAALVGPLSRRQAGSRDAAHGFTLEFDAPRGKITLRVTLVPGDGGEAIRRRRADGRHVVPGLAAALNPTDGQRLHVT